MQPNTLQQFTFTNYDLVNLKLLGQGSYGKVYKSKNLLTGQEVAIKQIQMKKIILQNLQNALEQEIQLMKQVKGANVVQLLDSHIGNKYTYIILELCDSDLRKKMNDAPRSRLKQQDCIPIFGGIMNGFKSLVENSCIHRDMKPENVLLKNGSVKIADFGFARKADLLFKSKYNQICGTPIYMSPQLLNGQAYTSKSDIWSLGLILYQMLCGGSPWPFKCYDNYRQSINKRPLAFPFDVKMGKQTKDFIRKCLVVQEDKRIDWQQLFKHPLIKDKIPGQVCLTLAVEPKVRMILAKVQNEAQRKDINQKEVFKKYSKFETLNLEQFSSLLKQINPTITSFQISLLFQMNDKNHDGKINRKQFETMFCEVNHRPDPVVAREVDQFIGFMKAKGCTADDLFEKFDKNKTKALDTNQFRNMAKQIAPMYGWRQIKILTDLLDKNKSGLIDKNQFVQLLGGGKEKLEDEKAKRQMQMLKIYINDKKLSPEQVMKIADLNYDRQIDEKQLGRFMEKISFVISKDETNELFNFIDKNKSGKICINELINYLK